MHLGHPFLSEDVVATVDIDGVPGHRAGIGARQKHAGRTHLLDRHQTSGRRALRHPLHQRGEIGDAGGGAGGERTGADRMHPDAFGPEFGREVAHSRFERRLDRPDDPVIFDDLVGAMIAHGEDRFPTSHQLLGAARQVENRPARYINCRQKAVARAIGPVVCNADDQRLVPAQDRKMRCVQAWFPHAARPRHRIAAAALWRRASATRLATAQDARRVSTESARLVRMIGTRAPSTMPAASAPARNDRLLASMFPASRSGTTSTLARPATGETICLMAAASSSIALSSASGPSRIPPVICPRSAILHNAAASIVEGTFGLTVSIADRIATRTSSNRNACPRSMAFCTISTLSARSGVMFTAASVMISGSEWLGTSITKQWLMRRAVRMPPSRATTAPISSSVCKLPFIKASALPSRTSATAFSAESWLCADSRSGK